MLELNKKTNVLEEETYRYKLQDIDEPNLYRDIYPYSEIPKTPFNHRRVPMNMPEKIWITDTTFRDGQQARAPYTVEQIVEIYKMLHRLGGEKGIIQQTEFFAYSDIDRQAIFKCMELGYEFPEVTTWIT
ncbi:MAG: 2-isopropylmalate synthase, partial [Clostridia bacterium]|nr:2-isopropylmalate synthase [Clostridia bacterium]